MHLVTKLRLMAVRKSKTYIEALVRFDLMGGMKPVAVFWQDGRRYDVTKIYSSRVVAPRGEAFYPVMYDCEISGFRRRLYYEPETGRWFVETDAASI